MESASVGLYTRISVVMVAVRSFASEDDDGHGCESSTFRRDKSSTEDTSSLFTALSYHHPQFLHYSYGLPFVGS